MQNWSIKVTLSCIIIVLLVVGSALSFALNRYHVQTLAKHQFQQQSLLMSSAISLKIAGAARFNKVENIAEDIQVVNQQNPNSILFLQVLDSNGKLIYSADDLSQYTGKIELNANRNSQYQTVDNTDYLEVWQEIKYGKKDDVVGQSSMTSDYWQGDEDKFKQTYSMGAGAIFVDKVEEDESTQMFQSQMSATIVDENGDPIGAITIGINVDEL